jgi:hypothetical protein
LDKAFRDDADTTTFRVLLLVGSWVAIGERFNTKRAELDGQMPVGGIPKEREAAM